MLSRFYIALALCCGAGTALGDDRPNGAVHVPFSGLKTDAGLTPMEWKVGKDTRQALVALPKEPAGAPVVFVWHGHGGTMRHAARSFSIHQKWPEAIVVYPQGLPTAVRKIDPEGKWPGWQLGPGQEEDRDLKFFDTMRATLLTDMKADAKRVFATGHSNGGRFVYVLWAARADAIAAFAPSASPAIGLLFRMGPKPCLHIAGEKDQLVSFDLQRATIERVRALNGCDAEGRSWGAFKGKVTLYPSRKHAPFVTAIYPGGHVFPNEAADVIVRFFRECRPE